MEIHPQNNYLNPAVQYNYSTLIFSPSGNAFFENSSLRLNDLVRTEKVNGVSEMYWDFETIDKKLRNSNFFNVGYSVNPVFLGIKLNRNWYGSFSVATRNNTFFQFPGTITDLRYGNADLENNRARKIDLNNYAYNQTTYAEFSFGISKKLNEKFTAGIHLKLITGLSAIRTNHFIAEIDTEDDFSSSLLKTDIHMDNSGELFTTNKLKGIFETDKNLLGFFLGAEPVSFRNSGFGADFGFIYQANNKLQFFGSFNDLGFIHWALNPQQLVSKGEYKFDGLYFSTQNLDEDFKIDDFLEQYIDTINSTFFPETESNVFNTTLNSKTYLGVKYMLNKEFTLNGLVKTTSFPNFFVVESTAGLTWSPRREFGFTGTWSYNNFSLYNLGFGAFLNLKWIQLFFVTDNINIVDISHSKAINISLGSNFRIIKYQKRETDYGKNKKSNTYSD